ncbi:MAG: hypothetical protein WAU69_01220 [Solirubrobacteraceae bacterium]
MRRSTASEEAGAVAWGLVADGYDAALKTADLSDQDRAWLLEQRRDALLIAGRPLLRPVKAWSYEEAEEAMCDGT